MLAYEYTYQDHEYTSECKSLWGEPERVRRISAVNIQDECTV